MTIERTSGGFIALETFLALLLLSLLIALLLFPSWDDYRQWWETKDETKAIIVGRVGE